MRRAATAALILALTAAALGACGDADDADGAATAQPTATTAEGAIELTVTSDDGAADKLTGRLTCRGGDQRAEGALAGGTVAGRLCAQARGLAELLTTQPDEGRTCSQIYGGPETARVTGSIDAKKVDRRFSRTNGCEIADFTRAAGLLRP